MGTLRKTTIKIFIHHIVLAIAGTLLIVSCKTDLEKIKSLSDEENSPDLTARNSEILYTEQGKLKIKVIAPTTNSYPNAEEPYTEFPDGITVFNFNDSLAVESQITANYAIYYVDKELWNARYNVVAMNKKGEILNTEQLFWDEKKKTIYSHDMVKITTEDGVTFGEGFESDEMFNDWIILKPTGSYYINESD